MANKQAAVADSEQDLQAYYASLAEELDRKASREFLFLKEGNTKVKILPDPGGTPKFFEEVLRPGWQGAAPKIKYAFRVVNIENKDNAKEQVIIVGKTVFKTLIGFLSEGYDLLSPGGNAVSITKSGAGLDTSYSVIPSPKPVPLPQYEHLNMTWDEIKALLKQRDEEGAAARAAGTAGGNGKVEKSGEEW